MKKNTETIKQQKLKTATWYLDWYQRVENGKYEYLHHSLTFMKNNKIFMWTTLRDGLKELRYAQAVVKHYQQKINSLNDK